MLRRAILYLFVTLGVLNGWGQKALNEQLDLILSARSDKPFNGVILVAKGDQVLYENVKGFASFSPVKKLAKDGLFVVGSISKQFTATLVLQEFERGNIDLNAPISTYLPELRQPWANELTVHHLLTHTHGITDRNGPLSFAPGCGFAYSQIGYDLLSKIVEKITGRSFAQVTDSLFEVCGMSATFHPDLEKAKKPVSCYVKNESGQIVAEPWTPQLFPIAAGGFISNAGDLLRWNNNLFNGTVLNPATLELMTSRQQNAVRNHPVFGTTYYGYGLTVDDKDGVIQYGQTGYVPGFVSMDFYFPQVGISVILLENLSYGDNLKESFSHHVDVLNIVRRYIIERELQALAQ